jgi:aryl-alcohol dehydrogenase-like predicted oxidoreductase
VRENTAASSGRINNFRWHLRIKAMQLVQVESLGALKEMLDAGKIRHIGLSEVSPEQIERARKILPIVTVQNRLTSMIGSGRIR